MVDGASALQRFRHPTVPMMLPSQMVAAMLRVIDLLMTAGFQVRHGPELDDRRWNNKPPSGDVGPSSGRSGLNRAEECRTVSGRSKSGWPSNAPRAFPLECHFRSPEAVRERVMIRTGRSPVVNKHSLEALRERIDRSCRGNRCRSCLGPPFLRAAPGRQKWALGTRQLLSEPGHAVPALDVSSPCSGSCRSLFRSFLFPAPISTSSGLTRGHCGRTCGFLRPTSPNLEKIR
jgi:hypothetical protein